MPDLLKIDSHVHVYPSSEVGLAEKAGYQIWEYGDKAAVKFSQLAGTLGELRRAMRAAGVERAVVVNLFTTKERRDAAGHALPERLSQSERERAMREADAKLTDDLKALNRWACDLTHAAPELTAYIAADPHLLPGPAGAEHVREMAERHGARGVKLHGRPRASGPPTSACGPPTGSARSCRCRSWRTPGRIGPAPASPSHGRSRRCSRRSHGSSWS